MANKERKTDLDLHIKLNDEQHKTVTDFYENDVNIVSSDYGCGKSTVACYYALQSVIRKQLFNQVIFTRPVLASKIKVLGYTPGTEKEKLAPFVEHLRYILNRMLKPSLITKYEENFENEKVNAIGYIQLEATKGWNLDNTLLVIDEAQDMTYADLRNILSRIGATSKVILLCSFEQIDPSMKYSSCIHTLSKVEHKLPDGVTWNKLTINNRNKKMYELIKKLDIAVKSAE